VVAADAARRPGGGTAGEVGQLRTTDAAAAVVDDVAFSVSEGEIFGLLGPNGAGKTTTVECVVGLRVPDSGAIRVWGLDPRAEREGLHEVVGVRLQASGLAERLRRAIAVPLTGAIDGDAG